MNLTTLGSEAFGFFMFFDCAFLRFPRFFFEIIKFKFLKNIIGLVGESKELSFIMKD